MPVSFQEIRERCVKHQLRLPSLSEDEQTQLTGDFLRELGIDFVMLMLSVQVIILQYERDERMERSLSEEEQLEYLTLKQFYTSMIQFAFFNVPLVPPGRSVDVIAE